MTSKQNSFLGNSTNYDEQKIRADHDLSLKKELYEYEIPQPNTLLKALKSGLPKSAGIALGVERLFHALYKTEDFFLFTSETEDN